MLLQFVAAYLLISFKIALCSFAKWAVDDCNGSILTGAFTQVLYNFNVLLSDMSGNKKHVSDWKISVKQPDFFRQIFHVLEVKQKEDNPPPPPAHHSKSLGYMGNGGLRYISLVLYHPFATIIIGRQPHRVWPCRWASGDRPHLSPLRLASRMRQATHTHTYTHTHTHGHGHTNTRNVGHHHTDLPVNVLVYLSNMCRHSDLK